MRLFNTVQELWSYCAFCPLCREMCREPLVDLALDGDNGYAFCAEKEGSHIFAHLTGHPSRRAKVSTVSPAVYDIDCLQNTFKVSYVDTLSFPPEAYCYIQSICDKCSYTSVYGTDMELNMESKKISNIGVERETIEILDNTDLYRIEIIYKTNEMFVYREEDIPDSEYIEETHKIIMAPEPIPIKLSIIEFDFSDQKKVINKLKTLILFS